MKAFGIASAARLSRAAAQGTFHRLFEVLEPGHEPRLLRVAATGGTSAADLMALECNVMTALRESHLCVPRCEYREVPQGERVRGVHLVERAAGMSLTAIDDDEPRMLVALDAVGKYLAELHRVRGSGFGPVSLAGFGEGPDKASARFVGVHAHWDDYVLLRLAEHSRACEARGAITGREAADIAFHFASMRPALRAPPSALLHGDPGSHNFMVDDSGIRAVIDWEDALLGDPLFDLASLCTFHPERRHAAIWSAYGAILEPRGEAWARFWIYFLRIALAKTVHRYRFAYSDRADRPPASRRIQLALDRLGDAR